MGCNWLRARKYAAAQFRLASSKEEASADLGASSILLYSIKDDADFEELDSGIPQTGIPCLFALDSGWENALI